MPKFNWVWYENSFKNFLLKSIETFRLFDVVVQIPKSGIKNGKHGGRSYVTYMYKKARQNRLPNDKLYRYIGISKDTIILHFIITNTIWLCSIAIY